MGRLLLRGAVLSGATAIGAMGCAPDDEEMPLPDAVVEGADGPLGSDAAPPMDARLEDGASDRRSDAIVSDRGPGDAMSDAMRDGLMGDVSHRDGPVSDAMAVMPSDAADVADAMPDAALVDAAIDGAADAVLDPDREHRCDDGLDDDGDGAVDCFDGDCLDDVPCNIVPETPVQFVQELFLQRCGCHTGALDLGGLRLVRPFTDTTVGVTAVLDPQRLLVVPGDVEASFLYLKLLDGLPPELGERMPPEVPYLDADQLALVADWIAGLRP